MFWGNYAFPLSEEKKVEPLMGNIASPKTELKTEVNIFRSPHSSSFFKAPTYVSTWVAKLYPSNNPFSGRLRK